MRVGVVVGRFQTHELHDGHQDILRRAFQENDKLVIAVGSVGKPPSHNNPLDFATREKLLREFIRDALIIPLHDHRSNEQWVRNLDLILSSMFANDEINLYVGRNSGLNKVYKIWGGKFNIRNVPIVGGNPSATKQREYLKGARRLILDPKSIIWATQNQFPRTCPTVDIIVRDRAGFILLVRKHTEDKWRFPGGFVDPTDQSYEMAARREAREELGDIELTDPIYIGSHQVDDWRYRNEKDKILTSVFAANVLYGLPRKPLDAKEIKEVLGFADGGVEQAIIEEHRPLWRMYEEFKKRR